MFSLHPPYHPRPSECVRCNRKRVAGRDKCQKCIDDSRHGSARLIAVGIPRGVCVGPGSKYGAATHVIVNGETIAIR